jgi:hypothetical protein
VAGPGAAPADDEDGGERGGDAVLAPALVAVVAAVGVVGDVGVAVAGRSRLRAFHSVVDHVAVAWRGRVVPSRRWRLLRVDRWVHAGPPLLHHPSPTSTTS